MRIRSWFGAAAAVALLAVAPSAARANGLVSANLAADCEGFTMTVRAALSSGFQGVVDYSIVVDPAIPGTPIAGSFPIEGSSTDTIVERTESLPWPTSPDGAVSITGQAHLRSSGILPLQWNGGVAVSLACAPERPAIDLEKEISVDGGATWHDADDEAGAPIVQAPHGAEYRLIVKNTGNVPLTDLLVNDATLGLFDVPAGDLAVGETRVLTQASFGFGALKVPDRCQEAGTIVNVADVSGVYGLGEEDTPLTVSDSDPALLLCTEKPHGGEGCTPGYWKQRHHFDSWQDYAPTDSYNAVFGVTASFNKTLLGALAQGGGGEKALGRHAVAALLNAANPDVAYAFTVDEVLAIVEIAYETRNFERAKNEFEDANEMRCPLN